METSRGFSLLELITCLAISTLMIASAVATLPALMRKQQLCHEAQRLQLLIDRARTRAIISGNTHSLRLIDSRVLLSDSFQNSVELLSLRHGITLTSSGSIAQQLSLFPNLAATPATLTLSLGALSSKVIVSLRARTRVVC